MHRRKAHIGMSLIWNFHFWTTFFLQINYLNCTREHLCFPAFFNCRYSTLSALLTTNIQNFLFYSIFNILGNSFSRWPQFGMHTVSSDINLHKTNTIVNSKGTSPDRGAQLWLWNESKVTGVQSQYGIVQLKVSTHFSLSGASQLHRWITNKIRKVLYLSPVSSLWGSGRKGPFHHSSHSHLWPCCSHKKFPKSAVPLTLIRASHINLHWFPLPHFASPCPPTAVCLIPLIETTISVSIGLHLGRCVFTTILLCTSDFLRSFLLRATHCCFCIVGPVPLNWHVSPSPAYLSPMAGPHTDTLSTAKFTKLIDTRRSLFKSAHHHSHSSRKKTPLMHPGNVRQI